MSAQPAIAPVPAMPKAPAPAPPGGVVPQPTQAHQARRPLATTPAAPGASAQAASRRLLPPWPAGLTGTRALTRLGATLAIMAAVAVLVAFVANRSTHGRDGDGASAAQIAQAARQRALDHATALLAASAQAAGIGVPVALDLPGGSGYALSAGGVSAADATAATTTTATTGTSAAPAFVPGASAPDASALPGAQKAPDVDLPPPVHLTAMPHARIPDAIEGSAALPAGSDVLSTLTIETRLRVLDASACPFLLLATQLGDGSARAQLQRRGAAGATAAGAAWYERGDAPAPGWQLIDIGTDTALLLTPQGDPLRLQRSAAAGAAAKRPAP